MKQYVYITSPESWLNNGEDYRDHLLSITESDNMEEYGWVQVAEIDIDVDVADDELRAAALQKIADDEQKQVAENEVRMQQFNNRRQKLLAIEYDPSPNVYDNKPEPVDPERIPTADDPEANWPDLD